MCRTQRKEQANLITELQLQADSKGWEMWMLSNLGRKGVITFVPSQVRPPYLNKPVKSGRQKKKRCLVNVTTLGRRKDLEAHWNKILISIKCVCVAI